MEWRDEKVWKSKLHKKYNRATPTQFQKYTTAVSFYDLVRKEIPEEDWIGLQFSIQNDRRNTRLSFQSNNTYRCGLNCLPNRLKSITNEIDKDWVDLTRDVYKMRCKKRLITEKLIMMRWSDCNNNIMFCVFFVLTKIL